jgi:hypothetical protein
MVPNNPVQAAEEQKKKIVMPYNPVVQDYDFSNSFSAMSSPSEEPTGSFTNSMQAPPGLNLKDQEEPQVKMSKGGVSRKKKTVLADGGMLQEGGTVDPVSGNEVPVGSMQEEVRDDIPAKLSEGEFVFPADVVRFIGLERLMKMRQEAKEGLKKMEAMGQMGNSEEATMEDDGEFETEIDDIIKEVEQENQQR